MKKGIALLLIVCTLLVLCGCEKDPATIEGPGFNSPEEAILAYAEALKEGDVNKILATFAIESYVENYDMEEYLEYARMYSVSNGLMGIDGGDAYTNGLNMIDRQYQISKNLTYLYLSLGKLEDITAPVSFNGNPYDAPSDLIDDLVIDDWMDILAEMEIDDVLDAEDILGDSDSKQLDGMEDSLERRADYLNCDEVVALALEVTIDGDDYYLCVDVACYDGKWYNCVPVGTLSMYMGAPYTSGGLVPQDS